MLEQLEKIRQEYLIEINKVIKKFREIKYLKELPGIKNIQAAKIVSQVIDAKRFRNKFKYFSYCGLTMHKRISGERIYGSEKIHGNHILKCVYKMAGKSALSGENVFKRMYEELIRKGVNEKNAYNAICRKIAEVSLSMMKNSRRFDADFLAERVLLKKAA
jgi:transposase